MEQTEIAVWVSAHEDKWDGSEGHAGTWKFSALWLDDEDETGPTLWLEDNAVSVQISWEALTAALESHGYTVPPLDRAQQGVFAGPNL